MKAMSRARERHIIIFSSAVIIVMTMALQFVYEKSTPDYLFHNAIRFILCMVLAAVAFLLPGKGFKDRNNINWGLKIMFSIMVFVFALQTPKQYPNLYITLHPQKTIYMGAMPTGSVSLSEIFDVPAGIIFTMQYTGKHNTLKPATLNKESLTIYFEDKPITFEWWRHVDLMEGNIIASPTDIALKEIKPGEKFRHDTQFSDMSENITWGALIKKLKGQNQKTTEIIISSVIDNKTIMITCKISKEEYMHQFEEYQDITYVALSCLPE